MNYLNFVCLFFMLSCSESPLLQAETGFQRFTLMAKKAYLDAVQQGRHYVGLLQDKCFLAKDYLMEKFKNLRKRGEPVFVGENNDDNFTEEEMKEMFEKLFKEMNFGAFKEQKNEDSKIEEDAKEEEAQNEEIEKPL